MKKIMAKYKTLLLEIFGEAPKIRIIDFLLDFPLNDFTKDEIIKALGMSKTTFYKNFGLLEEAKVVIVSRKIARAKLYKINIQHPMVKRMREIEKELSLDFARKELEKIKEKVIPQVARV